VAIDLHKFQWKLRGWVASFLPPCEEITKGLSRALDQRPSLKQRFIMRLHLYTCPWCTRYRKQIKFVDEAVKQRGHADSIGLPDSFNQATAERIKARLRQSSDQ